MALVQCPECPAQVSAAAAACPQCGHPIRPPSRSGIGKTAVALLWAFHILLLLWLVVYGLPPFIEAVQTTSQIERRVLSNQVAYVLGNILVVWAIGLVILGPFAYFTRARRQ